MRTENANGAAKNLQQTNIPKGERVQGRVATNYVGIKSVRKAGREPVYNMEVVDNHDFAVNGGFIVHNCMDATRYFVKTLRIMKKKTQERFKEMW